MSVFLLVFIDICCCLCLLELVRLVPEWLLWFHVSQSLNLCNPMDGSPPGSSVHGIPQARILVWVAISFSRGSSWPRDRIHVSWVFCIGRRFFTTEPPGQSTVMKSRGRRENCHCVMPVLKMREVLLEAFDRYTLLCCWLELVSAVHKGSVGAAGGLSLLWRALPLWGVWTTSGLLMGRKKCYVCWRVGEEARLETWLSG